MNKTLNQEIIDLVLLREKDLIEISNTHAKNTIRYLSFEDKYKKAEAEITMSPAVTGLGSVAMREAEAKKIMHNDPKYAALHEDYCDSRMIWRESAIMFDLHKELLSSGRALLYAMMKAINSKPDIVEDLPF